MTVTCIGFVIWWKMLFAPETLARHCYSICKNYNIFSGCCANSLHCYLVYCFDLILCRHYLVRRFMRPLFTLPGRASLDCIASWVGSSLTGALLTSTQYKDGYYTKREACVIMTCFSTAAFSFIFILTRVCGLEAYFLPSVLTIYAAVIPCAILLPRVYPLSKQKDEYSKEQPEIREEIPQGMSKSRWALQCAVEKPMR